MFFTIRVRENYANKEILSANSDQDSVYKFVIEAQKGNALLTLYLEPEKFEKLIIEGMQLLQERDRQRINETF